MPYKNREQYLAYQILYRKKNKEHLKDKEKKWRAENKEKLRKISHNWYMKNRVLSTRIKLTEEEKKIKRKKAWKEWYSKNKEKKIRDNREWVKRNRKKRNASALHYSNTRRKRDMNFRLSVDIRNKTRLAIRSNQRNGSTIKNLGCTIVELKSHIESKFKEGMTWENWGNRGWHIDHIKPLSSFDLSDKKQFLMAFHYSNIQPLWCWENIKKHNSQ